MISILQILLQGCLQRTSTQSVPIHGFNFDGAYLQIKYFPRLKSKRMCLSSGVHNQGFMGYFSMGAGVTCAGSHDRSQGRIGCSSLFFHECELSKNTMKAGKLTCITPPPLPEPLRNILSRPRRPAAQSIIRISSSVQAGLDAH